MNTLKTTGRKRKCEIFIVDDHLILREALRDIINNEDDFIVCGEAGDVSSAIKGISDVGPDLVLVDLTLGGGNGIRLIENLVVNYPDVLTLVLSMHDESVYAERCLKAGAKGYIMKDESSAKLMIAIRKVLGNEMYISAELGRKLLNQLNTNKSTDIGQPFECLTNRELEIYQLIGMGKRKYEIADTVALSVRTVETYFEKIKKKMHLKDVHEVIVHAVRNERVI